jgi:opacity protein-like surface antigen
MIRKFVMFAVFAVLAAGTLPAQQTPDSQQPSTSSSSSGQETPEVDTTRQRKTRPHDYRNWTFNVGGGVNLPSGTTRTYVKGGGAVATVGAARNFNKYFGVRMDFMWANLPLRTSALQLAQSPGGTDHVYAVTLDPIINIPVTQKYSGYLLVGPGFYHRSGKLDSSTVVPGSACNAFWTWWGTCFNGNVPLNRNFLAESQNEFGFNFGGGVARKIRGNLELYGEFRYLHGKHNNITTDFRPITIGLRW